MKKTILASIVIVGTFGQARADELMGYGSLKCSTINGYVEKAGKMMPIITEQWVTGFLSGLNMASQGQERDITDEAVDKLVPELKAFCATHPTDIPMPVVGKAWLALPRVKS